MRKLRFALRTLFKSPFVTIVAIVSLALGIGANAAIFSLFNQLLLRPLPVHEPERLVNLSAPGPKPGSQSCNNAGDCESVFSYLMFRDLERAETSFSGLAAHRLFGANLSFGGRTLSSEGMLVSGSYFPLLGVQPALGRLLAPGDDRVVGESQVAVLSHGHWTTSMGADPAVLNQRIVVNGQPMTIVGVAPRGFDGTTLGARPAVFVPITMRGFMEPGFKEFDNRRSYWVYLFARLAPGISIEQARTAINVPYRAIVNDVEASLQTGHERADVEAIQGEAIDTGAGREGTERGSWRSPPASDSAAVRHGVVLLIACANIANLLLARLGRARR